MERYCNYVLSIWNDVLKFVTGTIVNKMANDGMEEVRVSAFINDELCYTHLHGGFKSFIRSQEYIEKEFPILLDVELVIK